MSRPRKLGRRGAPPPPMFDDGVDPRTISDRRQPPSGGRKALQLCRQVQRTLEYVLTECGEPIDRLSVWSVAPAPNSARMLVTVGAPSGDVAPAEALAALHSRMGWLRSEVAAAICRKKAPELIFRLAQGVV